MEDGKRCLRRFSHDQKIASVAGMKYASYNTNNKLLLVARHTLTKGLQKCI